MAFTPPATRITDELIDAAIWNADLVGNMNTALLSLRVRKPSDETLATNTTLQNDDHLLLALATTSTYWVKLGLIYTANPTPGNIKFGFTMPTSVTVNLYGMGIPISGTAGGISLFGTSGSTNTDTGIGHATINRVLILEGTVVTGGTAGNLQLQWAQDTSSGTATVVKTNSTLWAVKIA